MESNERAWRSTPHRTHPLPAWARILVGPLPKTTAAMLHLDYLHRAANPLGAELSSKIRWIAADTIGCDYAKRYAEADLRRAVAPSRELEAFFARTASPSEPDESAIHFARKITAAAHTIGDAEFADLLRTYGPELTCAMVHTLAYCNFHNRILLAIGAEVEPKGPIPPCDLSLDPNPAKEIPSPPRPDWAALVTESLPDIPTHFDWPSDPDTPTGNDHAATDFLEGMESQERRTCRVPLPGREQFASLPPDVQAQSERIVWMTVSMGYQPRLTQAWFTCLRAFQVESQLDRVVSNSMFWVITRGNECFY